MPLPLITENMYFDTVLRALETVLAEESENQIALGGSGWATVRERFDPWAAGEFPLVNVSFNSGVFDPSGINQTDQTHDANFVVDCYASAVARDDDEGTIVPRDQRAADALHALITKVYYTVMSPINRDLGLTPGSIETPAVLRIEKFIPTESNIPVVGVIAARLSVKITFDEEPPQTAGVPLEIVNVASDTQDGGLVEQRLNVT